MKKKRKTAFGTFREKYCIYMCIGHNDDYKKAFRFMKFLYSQKTTNCLYLYTINMIYFSYLFEMRTGKHKLCLGQDTRWRQTDSEPLETLNQLSLTVKLNIQQKYSKCMYRVINEKHL